MLVLFQRFLLIRLMAPHAADLSQLLAIGVVGTEGTSGISFGQPLRCLQLLVCGASGSAGNRCFSLAALLRSPVHRACFGVMACACRSIRCPAALLQPLMQFTRQPCYRIWWVLPMDDEALAAPGWVGALNSSKPLRPQMVL